MEKKKGGILSLIPLAVALLVGAGGGFWLIASLIMLLCGVELNPIIWIIAGATFVVGAGATTVILLLGRKKKVD